MPVNTPVNELKETYYYAGIATTLQTIVTAAANTAGIIIFGCGAVVDGADKARVMSKSSAPSSVDDTAARTLAFASGSGTGSLISQHYGSLPWLIPPGEGLYAQKTATGADSGFSIQYEVL